jgi:hypothetical protein
VVQALIAALLLAGLTIGGQQWYIGHLNDKHEAYKSKVIAATVKAEQAAIATTKAIANIGEQRVTVYRDRIKTIEASTNVQIDPSGVPDCRVSDGVRDAINSARAWANSASARRTEAGVPAAPNDGREPREPRAPRG